jgi:predicted O-methyltransferase YrrM
LHPYVEAVLETGVVTTPEGDQISAHSYIPRDECDLIYRQVHAVKARQAVEIGMAFGVSTLCLCDALSQVTSINSATPPRLVAMDPDQSTGWRGVGIHQIATAGFSELVDFREEPSQLVLPDLVRKEQRFQIAFIDGWHTFDHALIDFFYVDQLLETGGVIIFDDVGYPSINALVRFVLSNRDYELVEALYEPPTPAVNRIKRAAKRCLRRLMQTDHDPSPEHRRLFTQLVFAHSVALCKKGQDQRRWDHFNPF